MTEDETHGPEHRLGDKSRIRDLMGHGLENMRQLMQPNAYRIPVPRSVDEPAASLEGSSREHADAFADASSPDEQLASATKTLAAVATAVWRIKSKLDEGSQASLPSELRHLPRHIQAAWDALAAGSIQIDDPTGQRYVPGMAVNVLTFQPLAGIGADIIHETIKPSIFFRDTPIQRADIIVARPLTESLNQNKGCSTSGDSAAVDEGSPDEKGPEAHGSNNN